MMDKCPFCGAETRPGDNFCLNCGNRLLSATPSAPPQQQAQPIMGDATLAAPDDWGAAIVPEGGTAPASGWGSDSSPTIAASNDPAPAPYSSSEPVAVAQAPANGIEHPARFILRSENGDVLQEYPLDKPEIVIGRAPSSDILLSKDKLTSRRHATVRYETDHYQLRDERSANGTFVNGQQIEEGVPRILQDGDHVGIGEHELIFRAFESPSAGVEDLPTVAVSFDQVQKTFSTQADELATVPSSDDFGTRPVDLMNEDATQSAPPPQPPVAPPPAPAISLPAEFAASSGNGLSSPGASNVPGTPEPAPVAPVSSPAIPSTPPVSPPPSRVSEPVSPAYQESFSERSAEVKPGSVTFNRLTSLSQPTLPDLTNLIAALSTLDGQITALQQQFNATQDAMRTHETELTQTANQLRTGVRRVAERMDNTIADVARSREALAWSDLLQLMEDVMNNPRDIEYVTKLARKARELNKVFQIHQNVLNAMAECNSLLRGLIGEDK
jgi:pSer/pThr/pTyr-binding forkhead associated (FHA) protein